jgi:hypothetical protein
VVEDRNVRGIVCVLSLFCLIEVPKKKKKLAGAWLKQ